MIYSFFSVFLSSLTSIFSYLPNLKIRNFRFFSDFAWTFKNKSVWSYIEIIAACSTLSASWLNSFNSLKKKLKFSRVSIIADENHSRQTFIYAMYDGKYGNFTLSSSYSNNEWNSYNCIHPSQSFLLLSSVQLTKNNFISQTLIY